MEAWTPVLTNIALLIIATIHCLVCIVSIYHLSKRVCPCFRPKQAYDHNQFSPGFQPVTQYVVSVDETKPGADPERGRNHQLCKELETKLQGETLKKKKVRYITQWCGFICRVMNTTKDLIHNHTYCKLLYLIT